MLDDSKTPVDVARITSESPTYSILVTWFFVTCYTLWLVCRKALKGDLMALAVLISLLLMVML